MQGPQRIKNYARTVEAQALPSLIEVQLQSYQWFIEHGLIELFDEISPIDSFNGNLRLYFPGSSPEAQEFGLTYWFDEPKYSEDLCLERDMSYAAPLYVRVALVNRDAGDEVITADIFMGDFPVMTEKGTFIINGTERVVVSQLDSLAGRLLRCRRRPRHRAAHGKRQAHSRSWRVDGIRNPQKRLPHHQIQPQAHRACYRIAARARCSR